MIKEEEYNFQMLQHKMSTIQNLLSFLLDHLKFVVTQNSMFCVVIVVEDAIVI